MKLLPFLLVGVFLSAATHLPAIPQTVGGLFVNASGNPRQLPVEDWFKDSKNWRISTLPQVSWDTGSDPFGRILDDPGYVFGIKASSLTVDSNDRGEIMQVTVKYDAGTSKIPKSDLLKRIARNVAVHTGHKQENLKDSVHFAGEIYSITVAPLDGNSVVALLKR